MLTFSNDCLFGQLGLGTFRRQLELAPTPVPAEERAMSEPTEAERVQHALIEVVGRSGADVGNDGPRLRTFLMQALGNLDGSAAGAVSYVDALVATADMQLSKAMARGLSSADAAKGLEGTGMAASMASWVVDAWSAALAAPIAAPVPVSPQVSPNDSWPLLGATLPTPDVGKISPATNRRPPRMRHA